jgi:hypothetical protein
MAGTDDFTPADLDALERCIEVARAESPSRAAQIDEKLLDQPRWSVGLFACGCAQANSLNLLPWQSPIFRASLENLDKPYGDPRGERQGAELLKKLLSLNLSRFEPDPMAAIADAERARAGS